jgi:hypothetical protein
VGPPAHAPSDGGKAKLKIKIKLNLHGVVLLDSVQQVEEEEYEETVKVYEPAAAEVRTVPLAACVAGAILPLGSFGRSSTAVQQQQIVTRESWRDVCHLLLAL